MKLCAEDKLLHELLRLVPVPQDQPLGPGDDCAAIKCGKPGTLILLKTDCIAEDVHFLRSHDPAKVGWKALCRPLSDIAAMGGTPDQALITFFSPPDLDSSYWKKFYRGLGRAARRFGVTIAGGGSSYLRFTVPNTRRALLSVSFNGQAPPANVQLAIVRYR
jgi:thiamine-monophosphate kinase